MAGRNPGNSTEADVLTPVDREPGNVVRMAAQHMPRFSALLTWSRAVGQPVWSPIARPIPLPPQDYIDADYVDEDYFL